LAPKKKPSRAEERILAATGSFFPTHFGVSLNEDVARALQSFMRTENIESRSQAISLLIRIALSSVAVDATPLQAREQALWETRRTLSRRISAFLSELVAEYEKDNIELRKKSNEPQFDLPETQTPWYEAPP
jgi:hypothetical protein